MSEKNIVITNFTQTTPYWSVRISNINHFLMRDTYTNNIKNRGSHDTFNFPF